MDKGLASRGKEVDEQIKNGQAKSFDNIDNAIRFIDNGILLRNIGEHDETLKNP